MLQGHFWSSLFGHVNNPWGGAPIEQNNILAPTLFWVSYGPAKC